MVNSLDSARELLDALADDRPAPGLVRGDCADAPKTAWLFPGQGSQYVGMAGELFDTEPVFAETMSQCAEAVAGILDRPLLDVIFGIDDPDAAETLQQTRHAQAAIFAVEMGLARLWQSWGFRARRGDRAQRRPVRGGLRRRGVQPGGRRPSARRTWLAVR